ncbi:exopolysaccharide Pel transporter PelG [Methylobacterium sp. J-068]|uniref:exopolysaccharide Pel transporter PelG n=1 Tax=Methylobacterium sp. J-068 TaxID=2836649 RepID=UPI001FB92EB5|nr:exopolysaccharide Pel transporter PelG [Methylobacterium sp. J-068]MCJ2035350.1 exopolysaccharide Pel transporter PelG [Methylobacterium sp. J-068]
MAGLGFALERMTQGRSLTSTAGAYVYAALLVAGPWIFTVLAIGGIDLAACPGGDCPGLPVFRSIIIYNALVSAILTGPIAFVCTRFVSDRIWLKRYESVTFAFVVAQSVFAGTALAIAAPFYLFAADLPAPDALAGLQNLMLMGAAWLLIPFLGAIRSYVAVAIAFAAGAGLMVALIAVAPRSDPLHLLTAFNVGLTVIDLLLARRLLREYGMALVPDGALARTLRTHWDLPLIGLTCALGLWVDKLIMWCAAPVGVTIVGGAFRTMPNYDTPMFWAQLASIPILAVFFVHVETNFFRLSRAFYGSLANGVSRRDLTRMMARLSHFVMAKLVGLFIALSAVALIAILISFVVIEPLGLRASQMGILRAALAGMVFQTSSSFCFIFLLYFDLRRHALAVSGTYFILNGTLTAALLPLGFPYFGYGNLLASALTFLLAVLILAHELPWLHFHAFVTNNTSLRASPSDG